MAPLGWGLLLAAAAAAAVDWWAVWTDTTRARTVERAAKPAALLALIGLAVSTPAVTRSAQPWLVAALACSLAGDILLLPPGRLVPGLVAFLLGHLAYIVAFAQLPGSVAWLLLGLSMAAATAITVGRTLVAAAGRVGLGLPVACYLAVICAMAAAATRTSIPAAVIGAWLFVASDAMLGWGEFVASAATGGRSGGGPRLRLGVIATYHVAQALLTLSLLFGG